MYKFISSNLHSFDSLFTTSFILIVYYYSKCFLVCSLCFNYWCLINDASPSHCFTSGNKMRHPTGCSPTTLQRSCCIRKEVGPEQHSGLSSKGGIYCIENVFYQCELKLQLKLLYCVYLQLIFFCRTQTKTKEQLPYLVFRATSQKIPPK